MNKNPNKHKVMCKKIARHYFTKDFDISPFFNMNISLLPMVFAMIEGNTLTNSLSAIFRLLKSIPVLCNVSSRHIIGQADDKQEDDWNFCIKRLKTN